MVQFKIIEHEMKASTSFAARDSFFAGHQESLCRAEHIGGANVVRLPALDANQARTEAPPSTSSFVAVIAPSYADHAARQAGAWVMCCFIPACVVTRWEHYGQRNRRGVTTEVGSG
jgi:hypothetical protein